MSNQTVQTPEDFLPLIQLGLGKTAAYCYGALSIESWQTAGNLAQLLKKSRASVYRALAELEQKGFVERHKYEMAPDVTQFSAVRLDKALENLAIYQRCAVRGLTDYQIERSIKQQVTIGARIIDRDWR